MATEEAKPSGLYLDAGDTIEFDGRRFPRSALSHWLYHAALARRGDHLAAGLCRAAGLSIIDADGKSYWPPS